MSSKSVGFDHATPIGIESYRSFVGRTDSIAPVVFVCEASPWPANIWYADGLQRFNDIVANAACIGNCRVGPDPHSFVNSVPKMLRELAENIAVDLRAGR